MKSFPTTLFVTFGFPGSGKTYFSENLAKKIRAYHLNIDQLRHTLFINPKYTPEEHKLMVRAMDHFAKILLEQGVSVIYDANLPKREYRRRLQVLAKRVNAKFIIVHLKTPTELAVQRISNRNSKAAKDKKIFYPAISEQVLNRIKNDTEALTKKENAIVVNGTLPFPRQYAEFKAQISRIR